MENGWVIDVLGSPFWIAPEMIQLKPHGPPVDIWAFAISILEVFFFFSFFSFFFFFLNNYFLPLFFSSLCLNFTNNNNNNIHI